MHSANSGAQHFWCPWVGCLHLTYLVPLSSPNLVAIINLFLDYRLQTLKNNTDIFFLFFQVQNKLKHEEAFTRLNLAKINQQWRQILRQIKTKELKQDVEVNGIKLTVWLISLLDSCKWVIMGHNFTCNKNLEIIKIFNLFLMFSSCCPRACSAWLWWKSSTYKHF